MRYVRFAMYEMKPNTIDASMRNARKELLPLFRQQPGFVAYQGARLDDGRVISFSVWETRAACESAVRIASDWVKRNMAKDVVSSQTHIAELEIDSSLMGTQAEMRV
jgi:heme-degrading monooxygenase HmoA